MKIEEQIAKIIAPEGWIMKPSFYGLKTEKEMLKMTLVGPVRSLAIHKAKEIMALVEKHNSQ